MLCLYTTLLGRYTNKESKLLHCTCNTFGKLLLQDEEDDDRRQGAEQDAHHQRAVVDGIAAGEVCDKQRHGLRLRRFQHDAGPEIGVPCVHEGDDRGGGIGGLHDRHVDLEEDADFAEAVDSGGVHDLHREVAGVLAEHHDHERGGDGGKRKAPGRVQELHPAHHREERDHRGDAGDHHGQQENAEEKVLSLGVIELKAVAGQRADQQAEDSLNRGVEEGVPHGTPEIGAVKQVLEVDGGVAAKPELALCNLEGCVRGSGKHPEQGEDRNEGADDQKDIARNEPALNRAVISLFSHVYHPLSG